jgi:nicotinamide-nucleotide amidase
MGKLHFLILQARRWTSRIASEHERRGVIVNEQSNFAEIISTGTEILQGLYADKNAPWLSVRMEELGLPVKFHHAVGDDRADTTETLTRALSRAALVVISGGLGPTEDDLNRFIAAEVCGLACHRDQRAEEMMRARFTRHGRTFSESNLVQAMIPEGALVLHNEWGTAPGFIIPPAKGRAEGRGALVALPGPPRELQPLFEQYVAPWIKKTFPQNEIGRRRIVRTIGRPESEINELIRELFGRHQQVTVGLRAMMGRVDVRLTARCATGEEADRLLEEFVKVVLERLGEEDVYGYGEETLEEAVARALERQGLSVACAESCTAGGVATLLTNVSGSSAYFNESYVTYSNEAKTRLLGVRAETIEHYGAVSGETAHEMAEGARRASGADIGVSVTGIAGPMGGTPEKPVGLVWFGLATEEGVRTKRRVFSGSRREVRHWAATHALDLVRRYLYQRRR